MDDNEQIDEDEMRRMIQPFLPDLEFREDAIYENRATAFLDILGFSSMVASSSDEIEKQVALANLLQEVKSYAEYKFFAHPDDDDEYIKEVLDKPFDTLESHKAAQDEINSQDKADGTFTAIGGDMRTFIETTVFSDSIVFSHLLDPRYPTSEFGMITFLPIVQEITLQFMRKGYLIRGGISYGKLFHKENLVFGPALIDAYKLETTTKYPRVAVSNTFLLKMIVMAYPDISSDDGLFLDPFARKDLEELEEIGEILRKSKPKKADNRVSEKWEWILKRIREAIEREKAQENR